MAKAPDYVIKFIKNIPEVWDDTKFVDGYPGEYVVLARKGDGRWYLAGGVGINFHVRHRICPFRETAAGDVKRRFIRPVGLVKKNASFLVLRS
jgi:hypothetical protein